MNKLEKLEVPNSICWNITNKCNDNCKFCYRDTLSEDLDFKSNKKILDNIISSGVKKVTFAGGEPLMYAHTLDLIKYAKENGIITSLTTNNILLSEQLLYKLEKYLDCITLSLDANSSELQTMMTRNKNHFNNVIHILEFIRQNNLSIKVKINTVVSKINKAEVKNMIELVEHYNIYRWKLFQFVPLRGAAYKNKDKFYITDEEFFTVKDEILKKQDFNDKKVITFSDRNSIESSYFVIFPNGDVKISTDLSDKIIGNLIEDSISDIWENKYYEKKSHMERTSKAINLL